MDDKTSLDEQWYRLADKFDEGTLQSKRVVNYGMTRNWRDFMRAGYNPRDVIKMMFKEDVWTNYKEILSLARENIEAMIGEFILENWNEFVDCGISEDSLAERCIEISDSEDMCLLVRKGVSLKKVLALSKDLLDAYSEDSPDALMTAFIEIRDCKPSLSDGLVSWLEEHRDNQNIIENVVLNADIWCEKFDIDIDKYIDDYLEFNGDLYFKYYTLKDLPKCIPPSRFLDNYTIERIMELSLDSLSQFVSNYLIAGGDKDAIAAKILAEESYSSNEEILDALSLLLEKGCKLIDERKLRSVIEEQNLHDD